MGKTVVFLKDRIVEYSNLLELEDLWLKGGKIYLTGEDLFKIAKVLSNKGYGVSIEITDQLKKDSNIDNDKYDINSFCGFFGKEMSSEVNKLYIIKGGEYLIILTKAATAYVSVFNSYRHTDSYLSAIRDAIMTVLQQ